jgi:hypothetical protein
VQSRRLLLHRRDSPLVSALAFCIGFLDNTDEAGEVAHPPAKRTTKKQSISLEKHALGARGGVWALLRGLTERFWAYRYATLLCFLLPGLVLAVLGGFMRQEVAGLGKYVL